MELARLRARLAEGLVIPAHPLALTAERRLDEKRQPPSPATTLPRAPAGSRWACGTANATSPETGWVKRADIDALLPRVRVTGMA
jgi:hypothetical protein